MKLIIYSYPGIRQDEAELLNKMAPLADGLSLRKDGSSDESIFSRLLGLLSEEVRQKTWLHAHFHLALKYGVQGIHLTRDTLRSLDKPESDEVKKWHDLGIRVSRSCHSKEEAASAGQIYDRIIICPVFDSISKSGHDSPFTERELIEIAGLPGKAVKIALGGINLLNIDRIIDAGFDGAAVQGSLWNSAGPADYLNQLKIKCLTDVRIY